MWRPRKMILWIVLLVLGAKFLTFAAQEPDLSAALTLGNLKLIKQLMANGADPNIVKGVVAAPVWLSALLMGQKPIFYAMSDRMAIGESAAGFRRQIGADALATAAARGYLDIIPILLEHGVDVNARAVVGTTAIMIAAANANEAVVRMLVDQKADVNVADRHGDTALMAAVRAGSLPIVKMLLLRGANPRAADKNGVTAAWWVARTDRTDILAELIDRGADLNAADNMGGTPLKQAVRLGQVSMATELLARGATGSVEQHPTRSLMTAIETSLPLIQGGIELWIERSQCSSCHHTIPGLRAILVARQFGMKLDQKLADKQLAREREEISGWNRASSMGATSHEASAGFGVPLTSQDRAYSLANALAVMPGTKNLPSQPLENLAMVLANLQFQDGRWIHGLARFPIESSDAMTTAYAIRGLQSYVPARERRRIDAQIANATTWLKHAKATTTDDLVGALYGFYWTKTNLNLRQIGEQLLRQQKPNGSWAQKPGMNGDAYATGSALFALHQTGQLRTGTPAYQRGVAYLLRTQEDDGSWLVPTRAIPLNGYLESGSPHGKHQFISFTGTCWATMALTIATTEPKRR